MFIINKYLHYYNSLCNNARNRCPVAGYYEKHHIIPRALGGSDDASNIVKLTAREHYIAHAILVRITDGVDKHRMINAWFRMSCQGTHPEFTFVNSRRFELARHAFANTAGWALRGKSYEELHGKEKSITLKQKRSTTKSQERKGKSWEEIYGVEQAAAMRVIRGRQSVVWNTGRKHSEDTRKRISKAAANRVYSKVECACGKQISSHNIIKHQSACHTFHHRKDL